MKRADLRALIREELNRAGLLSEVHPNEVSRAKTPAEMADVIEKQIREVEKSGGYKSKFEDNETQVSVWIGPVLGRFRQIAQALKKM